VVKQFENTALIDGLKISLVEKNISLLDDLPEKHKFIETLFISNNNISSLEHIKQFYNLKTLSIANNTVRLRAKNELATQSIR